MFFIPVFLTGINWYEKHLTNTLHHGILLSEVANESTERKSKVVTELPVKGQTEQ